MAISQFVSHMKSLLCLMHWMLMVCILAQKVDLGNVYIWPAVFVLPVLICEPVLKMAQMAVKSIFHLVLWVLWLLVLAGVHDLGCSYVRFALLALPFVKSKRDRKTAAKHIRWLLVLILKRARCFLTVLTCIPWMAVRLIFPMPPVLLVVQLLRILMQSAVYTVSWILWMQILIIGFEVPFSLGEAIPHLAKTGVKHMFLLCYAAKRTSIGGYIGHGHPATIFHDVLQYHLLSRDGQKLWEGFIYQVLDAHEEHRSWAGSFREEHLRMRGNKCVIEMKARYPATYDNLLLDLGKLAVLLMPHFETENQLAPGYVQQLYSTMTAPLLASNPPPSPEEVQKFVLFMRHHPALRPARKTNSFVRKVFEGSLGMDQAGHAAVATAVGKIIMRQQDWRVRVLGYGHVLINRVLYHGARAQNNFQPQYGVGAWQVFRFIRNFLTHGAQRDANMRHTVSDMEELDLIAAEIFNEYITELIYHLVMNIKMEGLLQHAWEEYL